MNKYFLSITHAECLDFFNVPPFRSYLSGSPAKEGFTGKERDDETGLDYFGARYYRPDAPGFLSVDPLASQFPNISPYAYANNNPLRYTDPTGKCPEDGSEGDAGDGDGYCLAEIEVTATRLPAQITIHYSRPNYLVSFAAFAAKTSSITQVDSPVLPFADAYYTGLLLGKLGTAIYDAATFTDQEVFETMLTPATTYPDANELARRLGVPRGEIHEIKEELKRDVKVGEFMRKNGDTNVDVGFSQDGTIVVRGNRSNKELDTELPEDAFKKE